MTPTAGLAAVSPSALPGRQRLGGTSGAITVECVDSPTGFSALQPEWTALLRDSAADGPFLTWEWMHAWWKHLARGSRLSIVAIRAGDELIGIAPLRLSRHRIALLARFDLLGVGSAGSDYLDVIVRRGWDTEAVGALARFASSQNVTLRLDRLGPTAVASDLVEWLTADGWKATTTSDGACPYIPLAGHTWESYLATLGSSHRANVRRRIRMLGQTRTVRFELATTEAQRRDALTALFTFHQRRYSDRGGSTAFMTPALVAFHDDVTRQALDRGWLRLFTLTINDVPAAVMYGFMYDRRFYFYQHGFDEQYAQQSVGLVLMGLSIRSAIEEHADEFDMLWGVEPYKFLWARDVRTLRRIQLFPPHVGGTIHRGTYGVRRTLGIVAQRARTIVARGANGS